MKINTFTDSFCTDKYLALTSHLTPEQKSDVDWKMITKRELFDNFNFIDHLLDHHHDLQTEMLTAERSQKTTYNVTVSNAQADKSTLVNSEPKFVKIVLVMPGCTKMSHRTMDSVNNFMEVQLDGIIGAKQATAAGQKIKDLDL